MNLLVISHTAPFDSIHMAGEKTHNYYLKSFAAQPDMNVHLITICKEKDYSKIDYKKYNINYDILVEKQNRYSQIKSKIEKALKWLFFPNDPYASFINNQRLIFYQKTFQKLVNNKYIPDCIILEFTHSILLVDIIKTFFPTAKIIASSHDVNYIGSKRFWQKEKNFIFKFFRKRQYKNLRVREIEALSKCDLIVTQNMNDIDILKKEKKLEKKDYLRIVPYYDQYNDIKRKSDEKTIIFYGAMSRPENFLSVKWFIENVFNKLNNEEAKFVIIGGNPPPLIKNYESHNIHITGFLEIKDIKNFFSQCQCMVVPLQFGSGIKVKILEAFSAGVPVITNEIGNEGIFAKNNENILLCDSAESFLSVLKKIQNNEIDLGKIGWKGQEYLKQSFDLETSKNIYLDEIRLLLSNKIKQQ